MVTIKIPEREPIKFEEGDFCRPRSGGSWMDILSNPEGNLIATVSVHGVIIYYN
jgi:hypothetical protein